MSEILYNGIVLPANWPPRIPDEGSLEPPPVPYLQNPPEVIQITTGRQLFVDDFLIESTSLTRCFGKPRVHQQSPVLVPQTEDELDAGPGEGELITRPVVFRGNRLFVNIDDPHGELRVAVLDKNSKPIAGLTAADCVPISRDSTCVQVKWSSGTDLGVLAGQPVRFRFTLREGRLFSFWVTDDPAGASYGYLAGGGPGYPKGRDLPKN